MRLGKCIDATITKLGSQAGTSLSQTHAQHVGTSKPKPPTAQMLQPTHPNTLCKLVGDLLCLEARQIETKDYLYSSQSG